MSAYLADGDGRTLARVTTKTSPPRLSPHCDSGVDAPDAEFDATTRSFLPADAR